MKRIKTGRIFSSSVPAISLDELKSEQKPKGLSVLKRKEALAAYALIAPNLIIYFVFVVLPVIASLVLSFTDWNFISGFDRLKFVGLSNFSQLPSDDWFTSSMRNNLVFTLAVPITMALGLFFALLLNRASYARGVLRSMIFMPYITSSIAIAIVWLVIFHPTFGPINSFLYSIGITAPPRWMGSVAWALPTIMFVTIWAGLGYSMLLYIAGLQAIPQELYEASDIDGAGIFDQFRFITFPLLGPTTFFLLITGIIGSFKAFDLINVMTQGGPGTATTMLAFYVYRSGFVFYRMGYASAVAWVLMIIVFAITLFQWWGQKKVSYDM
jgi:multiple sugar transport system permease protein